MMHMSPESLEALERTLQEIDAISAIYNEQDSDIFDKKMNMEGQGNLD
jgi:hypothetical protein